MASLHRDRDLVEGLGCMAVLCWFATRAPNTLQATGMNRLQADPYRMLYRISGVCGVERALKTAENQASARMQEHQRTTYIS